MKLAIFDGDGIGFEIVHAARAVLDLITERLHLDLQCETAPVGLAAHASCGTTFPDATRALAMQSDGILLGPLSTSDYLTLPEGGVNASATLRKELDLYANIRPVEALPDLAAQGRAFRIVLFRENTEGFYAVRTMFEGSGEFAPDPDTAFSLRKVTAAASRRIADAAFTHAAQISGEVCAVHKVNVLKVSDGLFLRECRAASERHPDVPYREEIVDATAANLVTDPTRYDVIVTTNLFGDILSNQIAALGGGLGLAGSLNLGALHAMAQAAHGSAPDIAGRDLANPTSILLSLSMLLEHFGTSTRDAGFLNAAEILRSSINETLAEGISGRTRDLGGSLGTKGFTQNVLTKVDARCRAGTTARTVPV